MTTGARIGYSVYRAAMLSKRQEAAAKRPPIYDDRPGHCWRCSHLTDNEDRTCDFCLLEIVG